MSTNEAPSIGRIRKIARAILIVVFFALLCLPILDSFFGLDKAPMANEKRELARFPDKPRGFKELQKFASGLEAYYNDHFGFRKRLIRWHHRWKRKFFKEANTSDVMMGQQGWLYYFAGDNMIEYARGAKPFKPEELENWRQLIEGRRNWLAAKNIRYVFVVPPDKHSIYPEYLPQWMTRVGPTTRLDQLIGYMSTNSTVPVIDLRGPLIEAKKLERTYLYTDTHWNEFGAFVGYQTLVRALSKQFPDLEPLTLDAFEKRVTPQGPTGDLAAMLNQQDSMPERDHITLVPKPPLKPLQIICQTNLLSKAWVPGMEPVVTRGPQASRKAMMFRDSFAGSWIPLLGYHFSEVVYVWQYNWDKPFIAEQKPDIVIDEILERFLCRENPVELRKKDDIAGATAASHQ